MRGMFECRKAPARKTVSEDNKGESNEINLGSYCVPELMPPELGCGNPLRTGETKTL